MLLVLALYCMITLAVSCSVPSHTASWVQSDCLEIQMLPPDIKGVVPLRRTTAEMFESSEASTLLSPKVSKYPFTV